MTKRPFVIGERDSQPRVERPGVKLFDELAALKPAQDTAQRTCNALRLASQGFITSALVEQAKEALEALERSIATAPPQRAPRLPQALDPYLQGILERSSDQNIAAANAKLQRRKNAIQRIVALREQRLAAARDPGKDPLEVRRFLARNDRALVVAALDLAANEEDNLRG